MKTPACARFAKTFSTLTFGLLLATRSHAASGSWAADADGAWNTAPSWAGNTIADGADATANFTNDVTAVRAVTLDGAHTLGNLNFGDGDTNTVGGWTVAGANTITLSTTTGRPQINVGLSGASTNTSALTLDARIESVLAGTQGFVKKGGGAVLLSGANTMSSCQLDDGLVIVSNTAALGSQEVVYNGGAVGVVSGGPNFANTNRVLTTGHVSIKSATGSYDAFNGVWVGSGTMFVHINGRLTIGGGSVAALSNYTGTINMDDSGTSSELRFNLGSGAVFYNMSSTVLNLGTNAGRVDFRPTQAPAIVRLGALMGDGVNTKLDSSENAGGTSMIWEIGYLNTSTVFNGIIRDRNNLAGRTGNLTKVGTGKLTLAGVSGYTGVTVVSNGVLALTGTASLSNTPSITVATGATFDVSGLTTEFSLNTKTFLGSGSVAGNFTATNGLISPGTSGTAVATLTFSNNLTLGGANVTNTFDLTTPGTGDKILIGGDLNLAGAMTVRVTPTGATIPNGTYTLYKWSGNFVGNTNVITLDAPAQTGSIALAQDLAAKEIQLIVGGVAGPANLTWRGDNVANNWDLATANWIKAGSASTFAVGDNTTFDNTGSNGLPVNFSAAMNPASVTVNATKDFVFSGSGRLTGSGTLLKTNSGKLTITTDNDTTGTITVRGGVLQIGNAGSSGLLGTSTISNLATLVINRNDSPTIANNITGSGVVVQAGAGSTLILSGANTHTGGTIVSNGTLTVSTAAGLGSGALVFAGGSVNAGVIALANPVSVTADSTLNNTTGETQLTSDSVSGTGGTLTLTGTTLRFAGTGFTFARPLVANITTWRSYNNTGTQSFSGVISGTAQYQRRWGSSDVANTGTTIFSGANTYSGGTLLREGSIGFGIDSVGAAGAITSGPLGTAALTQDNATYTAIFAVGGARSVGNDVTLNSAGQALIIKGGSDLTLYGPVNLGGAAKTIQVDNTAKTIFTGDVSSGDLTKTGSGTLYLNGNSSANSVTISAGTLGGSGTIAGNVTNNATLAPGNSLGTLTMSGNLYLNPGSTTAMELNAATHTNDLITGLASVTYGGTLSLANLGGTFTNGTSFKLFDAASYSGSFAALSPATPSGTQVWNTSSLAVDGTISIAAGSVAPVVLTNTALANGTNVQFSFSGNVGSTYRIWASTNLAATPITNTWTLLTNATFTGALQTFTDTQIASRPRRFYVLTVP